ncbi:MAG: hypothetical protein KGO83_01290, partial [Paenibacillaceae bacterium]|nr:hypothetical protein [Paenibacillaceae bacterium]
GQVARKGLFIMLTKICQTQPPLECMNKRWGEVQRLVAPHLRTIRSTDERIRSGIVQSICERLKLHTEKDCAHFGSLLITQSEAQVKAGFGPPKPPQRPEFGPQNPQNEKNKVKELITKCRESLSALAKKEVDLKKKMDPSQTKWVKELQFIQFKIREINKICQKYAHAVHSDEMPKSVNINQVQGDINRVNHLLNAQQQVIVPRQSHEIVRFRRSKQ